MKITLSPTELKTLMMEYDFNTGNTEYDDEKVEIFTTFSGLPPADRIIMLIYAESQSLRKTATILGVSYATIRKTVNEIRENLKNNLNKEKEKE